MTVVTHLSDGSHHASSIRCADTLRGYVLEDVPQGELEMIGQRTLHTLVRAGRRRGAFRNARDLLTAAAITERVGCDVPHTHGVEASPRDVDAGRCAGRTPPATFRITPSVFPGPASMMSSRPGRGWRADSSSLPMRPYGTPYTRRRCSTRSGRLNPPISTRQSD